MGFARTQKGARYRVCLKHKLRQKGISVKASITTKKLERLYRRNVGKITLKIRLGEC